MAIIAGYPPLSVSEEEFRRFAVQYQGKSLEVLKRRVDSLRAKLRSDALALTALRTVRFDRMEGDRICVRMECINAAFEVENRGAAQRKLQALLIRTSNTLQNTRLELAMLQRVVFEADENSQYIPRAISEGLLRTHWRRHPWPPLAAVLQLRSSEGEGKVTDLAKRVKVLATLLELLPQTHLERGEGGDYRLCLGISFQVPFPMKISDFAEGAHYRSLLEEETRQELEALQSQLGRVS